MSNRVPAPLRRAGALALATLVLGALLALAPLPSFHEVTAYGLTRHDVQLHPVGGSGGAVGESALAAPAAHTPDPPPSPIPASVAAPIDLHEASQAALDAIASQNGRLAGSDAQVEEFTTIGVELTDVPAGPLLVRTHDGDSWGNWHALEVSHDDGPDPGTPEASRASGAIVSEPIWVGEAAGYEVNVPAGLGADAVDVLLVGETGTDLVAVEPSAEAAVPGMPGMHQRSEWGAAAPRVTPTVNSTVSLAVVHHSVTANNYSPGQVPGIIRGMQTYHMQANGWDDLAYHFVVDKFGQLWEGRGGGADRPIQGGHAKGFNLNSVGVVVLGDYTQATPSVTALNTIGQVIGWKLRIHGNDPSGSLVYASNGNDRYAQGTPVALPRVVGHRDTGQTACPGSIQSHLPAIRGVAKARYDLLSNPFGSLDSAQFVGPATVEVSGWAIDPDTTGAADVHVLVNGVGYAVAANQARPDVGEAHAMYGPAHGYRVAVNLPGGVHRVCAYGINVGAGTANPQLGCQDVWVPSGSPFGTLDAVDRTGPTELTVRGWAIDPDTAGAATVHVYVDGVIAGVMASDVRPDLAAVFPGYGAAHGYSLKVWPAGGGIHQVCAYAVNAGPAAPNTTLGCATFALASPPVGSHDTLTVSGPGQLTSSGWSIDPDTAAPVTVHTYVDGVGHAFVADRARPDVHAAFPGWGPAHGFVATVGGLAAGPHNVCQYGLNAGAGSPNTTLGCRSVTIPGGNPVGSFDELSHSGAGTLVARGWALDPDTANAVAVRVHVDGVLRSTPTASATRGDVGAAFPGWGAARGFNVSVGGLSAGPHQVCITAVNQLAGADVQVACRTATV